jgi:chromosome condensin MukBEF MukE localization factor
MEHMTPLMIEYLLGAVDMVGESTEEKVDAAALREKTRSSLKAERDAWYDLERLGYISSRGADVGWGPGRFRITEAGLRAAAEAREHGWTWPPTVY